MKRYLSIHSYGDSFTYGTDLLDCDIHKSSEFTWPALLAKNLNLNYKCHALGGIGNQLISYIVFEQFSKSTYKDRNFYIINWTWIERFDYIDPGADVWATTHPRHTDKLDHFFYKNIDSQPWNMLRNLQIIWSTISFLKQNNCDFVMTCLDNSLWDTNYDIKHTPAIWVLQNLVRPYIVDFEGKGFLDWSNSYNFNKGITGHPLESAHEAAAKLMLPFVKDRYCFH